VILTMIFSFFSRKHFSSELEAIFSLRTLFWSFVVVWYEKNSIFLWSRNPQRIMKFYTFFCTGPLRVLSILLNIPLLDTIKEIKLSFISHFYDVSLHLSIICPPSSVL
jgi:hypothetical protein